jgi:hypothetical protein
MTWAPTSPVTGGTMSQFTTPTYTLTTDVATAINGKQHAVTTIGGTQTNVRAHAVSDPFTFAMYRPTNPRSLPAPNPVTGKYPPPPMNTYGGVLRKGVNFAASNAPAVMQMTLKSDVPAGADAYDSANVRAAVCLFVGLFTQQSQGYGDLLVNGIL